MINYQEKQSLRRVGQALWAGMAQFPDQAQGRLGLFLDDADRVALCAVATVACGGMPTPTSAQTLAFDMTSREFSNWSIKESLRTMYFGRECYIAPVPDESLAGTVDVKTGVVRAVEEMELFDLIEALNDMAGWTREQIADWLDTLIIQGGYVGRST